MGSFRQKTQEWWKAFLKSQKAKYKKLLLKYGTKVGGLMLLVGAAFHEQVAISLPLMGIGAVLVFVTIILEHRP